MYTVIMHFNKSLRNRIQGMEVLTEEFIDAAVQEI